MSSTIEVHPQPQTPDVHLDTSLEAELIGLIFSAMLFGVINVQVLTYYQSYELRDDPKFLKWMISFVWLLNAFLFALMAYYNHSTFVTHFTDTMFIGHAPWCLGVFSAISEISLVSIRLFYTRRIWIMSDRNLVLTGTAIALNLTAFTLNIIFAAKLFSTNSFFHVAKFSRFMLVGNGIAAVADLWNALPLCYFLRRGKSGRHKILPAVTDTMINKLMIYIVGTGLLTSMAALSCFITYATMPDNMIYVALYSCVSPLYFNAMLASVNSRERLREKWADKGTSLNIETWHVATPRPRPDSGSTICSETTKLEDEVAMKRNRCEDSRLSPVTTRTETKDITEDFEARLNRSVYDLPV